MPLHIWVFLAHLQEVEPQTACSQNTSYARLTPNSICADHPDDGRVTLETLRGIDS
jgi:hypothetical protein